MIWLILYIVLGQAYGYYVHCKYPYPAENEEQRFVVVLMEHIVIPLFFPIFIIIQLLKQ